MISKFGRFCLIFFFSIFLTECSLDSKTGIWKDKEEKINKKNNSKVKKLSTNKENINKEINPNLKIKFSSKKIINNQWTMSGFSYSNLISHLQFEGKVNNSSRYKFKKIKHNILGENSIVLKKDYFITVDNEGTIIKISNNKKILWKKSIYKKKEKKKITNVSLTLYENKLYAADNLGNYYSLNINNGKIIWKNKHNFELNSQIKIYKKKIFAVDSNNTIYCFSSSDGKVMWKFKTNPTFIKTNKKLSIILKSDTVLFINTAGDIAKLNVNTGELIWFVPTQNTLIKHETNFLEISDIVLFKKNLFFSNNFSQLFSLNWSSGFTNWIINVNSTLRPIIIDNYLFTVSKDGYLLVVDTSKGEVIKSNYILGGFKKKQKKKLLIKGFLIASNKIYITTNLGYLIVCDANTGKVQSLLQLDKSQLSNPYINKNKLYILTNNSLLIFS